MADSLLSFEQAGHLAAGLSESTIRRLVKMGEVPEPVVILFGKNGRPARVGFVESEIRSWCAARIAASREPKRSRRAQADQAEA
jgi:predicted DNA-binding transcriptional regulator AlpA